VGSLGECLTKRQQSSALKNTKPRNYGALWWFRKMFLVSGVQDTKYCFVPIRSPVSKPRRELIAVKNTQLPHRNSEPAKKGKEFTQAFFIDKSHVDCNVQRCLLAFDVFDTWDFFKPFKERRFIII